MASASKVTSGTAPRSRYKADPLVLGILFALLLTVFQRVVGLVRSLLFCRMLPDEELGKWSLVYSFLIFFAPLVILGLPGCFGRFVEHYRQRQQLRTFLLRISSITFLLSVIALIAMSTCGDLFSWLVFGNTNQQSDVLLLGFVLFIVIWHNFLAELLESMRQIRLVAWMRFISAIVFAVVSVGCIIWHGPYVSSLVIGYVAGFALGSVPGVVYLIRHPVKNALDDENAEDPESLSRSSMWRRVLPYAGWIWAINALMNLFSLADRYMLLHFSSADNEIAQSAVGQYHSGMVIPMLLSNLAVLITGALMPYMSAAWEKGNREEAGRMLRTTLKLCAIGFTGGSLFILLVAPWMFETILQGRYDDGLRLLPLAFTYYTWFALSNICLCWLWCHERGGYSAISMGIGLLANLAFNIWLIPLYGIYGAVAATMIANGLALVLMYLLSWYKEWKIDFGVAITSLLPLVLLVDQLTATAVLLCLFALIINGNRIFDQEEKRYVEGMLDKLRQKAAPALSLIGR